MRRISIYIKFLAVLFVMDSLTILVPTSLASSLEEQEKALTMIAEFAERFCEDIPLEGHGKNIELTGKAKAELSGIISKLAKLGIEGAAKYQDQTYEGVLQKDLANALKNSTDCRLIIWNDLKDRLLMPTISSKVPSDPCDEYKPPSSDYIHEITEQAEKDAGSKPYITNVIREAIYVGHFLLWVADCGKIQTVYKQNIGNVLYRVSTYPTYEDSYGRECRELVISKKVEGRWHGSTDIYCRVRGKWTVLNQQ